MSGTGSPPPRGNIGSKSRKEKDSEKQLVKPADLINNLKVKKEPRVPTKTKPQPPYREKPSGPSNARQQYSKAGEGSSRIQNKKETSDVAELCTPSSLALYCQEQPSVEDARDKQHPARPQTTNMAPPKSHPNQNDTGFPILEDKAMTNGDNAQEVETTLNPDEVLKLTDEIKPKNIFARNPYNDSQVHINQEEELQRH